MNDRVAAVVLAGERPGPSVIGAAAGVPTKVLAEVAGKPLLEHVLTALERSGAVSGGVVVGRDVDERPLATLLAAHPGYAWLEGRATPAASAAAGAAEHDPAAPVFLTTGDHPLLAPATVADFLAAAGSVDADVVIGLARHAAVMEAVPGARCTALKFADDWYCGCNLFLIRTARGREILTTWQTVERHRKRPWRIVQMAGAGALLRFLLGRLTLADGLDHLSRRTGMTIRHVAVGDPHAALDVDKPEDLELARRLTT